jgi:rRNA maturation endonuclease Nob1
MARKCSSCGTPAPDGESRFCNRCGAAIVDEPEVQYPVCSSCGAKVADPEAQFCDKCGASMKKSPACPACGNPAIDENSKFCTRCGTTFTKPNTCPGCGFTVPDDQAVFCNRCGTSLKATPPAAAPSSPSVIVTKKRTSLPVQEDAPAEWDPWTDGSPDYDLQTMVRQERQYSPPPAPVEDPGIRAPQVSVPGKKYSHLPLIADELKGPKNTYTDSVEISVPAPPKRAPPAKKGVLNFLKK